MAMRLLLLLAAAVLASAATAATLHSRDQLPLMADTAMGAATPPPPALHRICLPSSKASQHWPSVLSSLSTLAESHPQFDLDFWTDAPRLTLRHDEAESCLDFTYPDHPQANALLDDLVHAADVRAEVDWSIVAGADELRAKVMKDKEERRGTGQRGAGTLGVEDHFHNGYHTLANITAWLSWQVFQHPSLAQLVELGTSYEEKVIQGIRIGDANKPEVVIVAGAHGREWITTSVSLYLISHLLDLATSSPSSSLLQKFSILIIPVLNPDGYDHTWRSSSDRFFRKNRQQVPGRDWWGRQCYGVDVSRNFPVHFPEGKTGQPCSPTYAGEEPLVTAESKALAAYLEDKEKHNVVSFLDLHSYGQLLLYPWLSCQSPTTSPSSPIPDEEDITELTLGAARAAKLTHNKQYRSGRGCETMYGQDGSSVDYAYGQVGVKWSFELELRDEGAYGFLLPPEQIRPAGEEAGAVLGYALEFVARRERL